MIHRSSTSDLNVGYPIPSVLFIQIFPAAIARASKNTGDFSNESPSDFQEAGIVPVLSISLYDSSVMRLAFFPASVIQDLSPATMLLIRELCSVINASF